MSTAPQTYWRLTMEVVKGKPSCKRIEPLGNGHEVVLVGDKYIYNGLIVCSIREVGRARRSLVT